MPEESCWCCREHGLTTPATEDGGLCKACHRRSPTACKTAHEQEKSSSDG